MGPSPTVQCGFGKYGLVESREFGAVYTMRGQGLAVEGAFKGIGGGLSKGSRMGTISIEF